MARGLNFISNTCRSDSKIVPPVLRYRYDEVVDEAIHTPTESTHQYLKSIIPIIVTDLRPKLHVANRGKIVPRHRQGNRRKILHEGIRQDECLSCEVGVGGKSHLV